MSSDLEHLSNSSVFSHFLSFSIFFSLTLSVPNQSTCDRELVVKEEKGCH